MKQVFQRFLKAAAAAALVLSTVMMGGCSSGPAPEATVQQYFKALQSGNEDQASGYVMVDQTASNYSVNPYIEEINAETYKKLKFQVGKSVRSGDTAIVAVNVTTPDLQKISSAYIMNDLPKLMSDIQSNIQYGSYQGGDVEQKIEDSVKKGVTAADAPMTTTPVNVGLQLQSDKTWRIVPSSTLTDAVTGGVENAVNQIYKSLRSYFQNQSGT